MGTAEEKIVLVADDEEYFRRALVGALQFFDYTVREAKNGDELLREARNLLSDTAHPTFVLVVDNQMPQKEGGKEEQWCGLTCIIELAKESEKIHERVLFLSRWGLDDLKLSDQQKTTEAEAENLTGKDYWLHIYTPFFILKENIDRLLSSQVKENQ